MLVSCPGSRGSAAGVQWVVESHVEGAFEDCVEHTGTQLQRHRQKQTGVKGVHKGLSSSRIDQPRRRA